MSEKTVTVVIYDDKSKRLRWRCLSGNSKVLARSPRGYELESELVTDLNYILSEEHDAELYRDRRNEWRWRFRNADGKSVAISSEGYKNRGDCKEASDLLLDAEPI